MLPRARDGRTAGEVARHCAAAAGRIITAATARTATAKGQTSAGRSDIVTETDPAVEQAVRAIILTAYPDHGVMGEESGHDAVDARWQWVVDPVDGTRNFSSGVPLVAFNLALYDGDHPRLALTLDPLHDELFYAEAGQGATLNGAPMRVRDAAGLSDAFFACDLGLEDGRGKRLLAALHDLFPGVQAMRLTGSTALGLAYVAAGRFDVYVHPSPYAWDFAPGVLLVQEAGGVVTQMDGGPVTLASRSIVAAAPRAHDETVERFRAVVAPGPA